MDDELYNRFKNLSDEELLNMVDGNSDDFTEEALNVARKEAEARGGTELLYKKIEEQMEQVQLENQAKLAKKEQDAAEALKREQHEPHQKGLFSGVRTLKEETILNEWAMILDHAGGNAQTVLVDIQKRLEESQIPGECTWSIEEVKSSTWIARVRREFLVVTLEEFKDYHHYIGIRDYGIHLDCSHFFTAEPGILKGWASKKIYGDEQAMSAPRNILVHQDLRAWAAVVRSAVKDSVKALMIKLGQDPRLLRQDGKGILEIW